MVEFKHLEYYFLSLTINNTTFLLSISLNNLFLYSLLNNKNFIKKQFIQLFFLFNYILHAFIILILIYHKKIHYIHIIFFLWKQYL